MAVSGNDKTRSPELMCVPQKPLHTETSSLLVHKQHQLPRIGIRLHERRVCLSAVSVVHAAEDLFPAIVRRLEIRRTVERAVGSICA